MPDNYKILPNFLYVGTCRAGSTWIYYILREHPEVFVPAAKDIMFFDRYFDKGADWYLSFFNNAEGYKAIGELSHDYFLDVEYALRIKDLLPKAKIFCCLREVADQLLSTYLYTDNATPIVSHENTSDLVADFESFVAIPNIRKRVDYYWNLKPFYELFSKQQILVMFYEDLKRDPKTFAQTLFRFLDVDPDFAPPTLSRKINATRAARSRSASHSVYYAGQFARKLGMMNLVGRIKHNPIIERILFTSDQKPTLPEPLKARIRTELTKDFDKLPELIGRPLPSEWQLDRI